MATSYIAILRLPTASTFSNGGWLRFNQTASGSAGPISGLSALLDEVKTSYETQYGGTLSWVSAVDGAYTVYNFTFSGLTTDPLDVVGELDIVSFSIIDDASTVFSAAWLSTTVCEDNGLCGPGSTNPLPGCQECFEAIVDDCDDVILALDFDADTTYQVMLEDWTGTQNLIEKTSDSEGKITISSDDWDTGQNVEGSYPMKVTVYKEDNSVYTFAIGSTAYTCVTLKFKNGASDQVPDPLIGTASQA